MGALASCNFSSLAGPLSCDRAVRELETYDEQLVSYTPAGKKFSWLVLEEYYHLCNKSGCIEETERWDGDWARGHFDRSSEYRLVAIAHVVSQLMTQQAAASKAKDKIIEEKNTLLDRLEHAVAVLIDKVCELERYLFDEVQLILQNGVILIANHLYAALASSYVRIQTIVDRILQGEKHHATS